jgi:SHS2 domain-containing protein
MSMPAGTDRTRRGHRTLPHTADVRLAAWGPDRAVCFEEAVAALLELCVETDPTAPARRGEPIELGADEPDRQLVHLLDHVLFVLDTVVDEVPVGAAVEVTHDGAVRATLVLVSRERVQLVGSVPKAIARSGLAVAVDDEGSVRCQLLVDV